MSVSALAPRKQPRQARAASTVEVILQAAARVLAAESLAGFNTNRVAQVAGVSVGSLYQYFPNKASLIVALIEREQATLAVALHQAVAQTQGQALRPVLAALVAVAIQHQFGNAGYAAALDLEERRLPVQALLGASQQRIVQLLSGVLRQHRAALAKPLPATAAIDCLTISKALIENQPSAGVPNLQALARKVLRALLGYLQHTPLPANKPATKLRTPFNRP
jgi:AcrR family transcriptional regulator